MDSLPSLEDFAPLPLKPEIQAHMVAQSVVQIVVFVVVALRFYSRSTLGGGLGLDDLMVFFSLLTSCAVFGLIVGLQVAGAGYDQLEAMMNIPTILLLTFIVVPNYLAALLFSKLSMLAFYLRVFDKGRLRTWTFCTIALCVAWFISHLMGNIFICNPVEAQWKIELAMSGENVCADQIPLFQSMIISNMFTDIIIMILPLKTIWGLQMRMTEKLALLSSFLLLGAVIIVGSVRVHYVSTVDMRENLTMTMPTAIFLTTLEPNFAILCVSIPTLRPLYRTYRARYGTSRGATKLSDHTPTNGTIGGGGAKVSRNHRVNSGGDDIALFTIGQGDLKNYNPSIEARSAQSLDSEASAQKFASYRPDGAK